MFQQKSNYCSLKVSIRLLGIACFVASGGGGQSAAAAGCFVAWDWSPATAFPIDGAQYDPVEHNGFIYVIGGSNGTAFDSVYYARANADGSLEPWTASEPLPTTDQAPGVTVWDGRIYVGLGDTGNLYWAELSPCDGSLGAWQGPVAGAPYQGLRLAVEAYAGYLYSFGTGGGCNISAEVWMAPLNADGSPGTWTQTTSMPEPRQHQSVHFYNRRVYIAGGIGGCGGPVLDTSHSAPVNCDGTLGDWRLEADLPHTLWQHTSVLMNGSIYLFGGFTAASGGDVTEVYEGVIKTDGTIERWRYVGDVPDTSHPAMMGGVYVPSIARAYLIGGTGLDGTTDAVWTTPLDCVYGDIAPCGGDGRVDLDDILAVLSAFAGNTTCTEGSP